MQGSCPCIYIYIQRDGIRSRREMAGQESLASQGSLDGSRPVFYISPGILEGALGLSQDNRAAPFDHRKVNRRAPHGNG